MKIFLIGTGNVAHHLCRALIDTDHTIVGYFGRSPESFMNTVAKHYNDINNITSDADLYILCISDDAISAISQSIPLEIRKKKIIAHTSGTKPISDLKRCSKKGIFYPLQTFTKGKELKYDDIPFCIHAEENKIAQLLHDVAESISSSVQYIDDDERRHIHLSAVMINNFVNHLIYRSEEFLSNKKIDSSILQPLLRETIRKQANIGAFDAQTGPARRNDTKTIHRHIRLLQSVLDKEIYRAISKSIKNTYK